MKAVNVMDLKNPRLVFLGVVFTSGLALGEACKSSHVNSNHCSFLEGDATCADRHEGALPYCGGDCVDSEHNDGCVMEIPVDCYYPCGDDMLADEDMSCLGMTDTNAGTLDSTGDPSGDPTTNTDSSSETETATVTSGETETTDPTGTTGPQGCQNSGECTNPAEPVCLDNECVPCTDTPEGDTACMSKDANFPVCNDDGQCVQCNAANDAACTDTTPVCDAGTSTCVGCTYHEQCDGTACDIATGACFDDVCLRTVDGDGPADFDNISDAIADGCVITVHDGGAPYFENLEIDGITVAILAANGEQPRLQGGTTATMTATGDANIYVQDMVVSLNGQDVGVRAIGARVYLDRSQVLQNADGGIDLQTGSYSRLRNSFVGGNGNQFQDHHGIVVANSMLDVVYSSIVANDGNGADSLACSGAAGSVRNSILVGADADSVDCDGVTLESNAVDEAIAGNENVGPLVTDWFLSVPDELHLNVEGVAAFAEIAEWNTGDPTVDIDGDPRPDTDATADHAGADRP